MNNRKTCQSQTISRNYPLLIFDSNNAEALDGKGNSLTGLGNYNAAITFYDKTLAIGPNNKAALTSKNLSVEKLNNNNDQ
jgi:tetratricopeptide (TPR) repeat protein